MGDGQFEQVEYPPKPPLVLELDDTESHRKHPLTKEEFGSFLDTEGRLVDEHHLRQAVFKGGVEPSIRKDIWQFLFNLYPFHSTAREREVMLADYHIKYNALKSRWKPLLKAEKSEKLVNPAYLRSDSSSSGSSVDSDFPESPTKDFSEAFGNNHSGLTSPEVKQQLAFAQIQAQVFAGRQTIDLEILKSALRVIDKDVPRTDRDCEFFSGKGNPNLRFLRDILITYAAFHLDVNYAQGMNDIASRFLTVFESEVEAYWCFSNYMETIKRDFIEDSLFIKLRLVKQLLTDIDAELIRYLNFLQVGDMTFCHRWMLLSFKREFNPSDSIKCFEILSCHHLELSSMEAEKVRDRERRKDFEVQGGKSRIADLPVNAEFTFDVFMCARILLDQRDNIFRCCDTSDIFQLISELTMKLNLDDVLIKTESLFNKYCQKSVTDCFQVLEIPLPTVTNQGMKMVPKLTEKQDQNTGVQSKDSNTATPKQTPYGSNAVKNSSTQLKTNQSLSSSPDSTLLAKTAEMHLS